MEPLYNRHHWGPTFCPYSEVSLSHGFRYISGRCGVCIIRLLSTMCQCFQSFLCLRAFPWWMLAGKANYYYKYCNLRKEGPWVEHLTSLPKRGMGALLSVFACNHEREPMSCLQQLGALKANNWTNNNAQRNHQWLWSQVLTAHSTQSSAMSPWVDHSANHISYISLCKDAL